MEQVLFVAVGNLNLGNRNEFLVFANVVGKAFVTECVDFAGDNEVVGPNFY